MTDDARATRAKAYAALAAEYLRVAQILGRGDAVGAATRPFWALLAHALELAIKARLRAAGLSEERLLTINHGLGTCLRLAGLDDDTALADLVAMLDGPHSMQAFRYPQCPAIPEIDAGRALAIVASVLADDGPRR